MLKKVVTASKHIEIENLVDMLRNRMRSISVVKEVVVERFRVQLQAYYVVNIPAIICSMYGTDGLSSAGRRGIHTAVAMSLGREGCLWHNMAINP